MKVKWMILLGAAFPLVGAFPLAIFCRCFIKKKNKKKVLHLNSKYCEFVNFIGLFNMKMDNLGWINLSRIICA